MLEQVMRGIGLAPPASALSEQEFAELYRLHTPVLFNYCLFRVGERSLAEDLAADTVERAWQSRHRYDPTRASFTTWLLSIARHVVANWLRWHTRRPLVALSEALPDPRPAPDAEAEFREREAELQRLLQPLSAQEQELLALKFGAGLTNRDIARMLGKSESSVGSALHRIMQKLRAHQPALVAKEW
jgi:RNA polymerase sigma-70 factor (ECF subfamily)